MPAHLNFLQQESSPSIRRMQWATAGTALVSLSLVALFIVNYQRTGDSTATIAQKIETSPASESSSAPSRAPKRISENEVISVVRGPTRDSVKFYERLTGRAFSVDISTLKTTTLSDRKLSGFIETYWTPTGDQVVSMFQEPEGIRFRSFSYKNSESTAIDEDITSLALSPDGRSVAYLKATPEGYEVKIGSIDGSGARTILKTRAQDAHLTWPTQDFIFMISRKSDARGSDLSTITVGGALSVVIENKENLEYKLSLDGFRLLYSYFAPEEAVSLWYRNGSGQTVALGIATSAQKCAWHDNNSTITCGVPTRSSLTRDIPSEKSATIDDVISVDLLTGQQSSLYIGSHDALFSVIHPLLSSTQKAFVFTNLFDQKLYMLSL